MGGLQSKIICASKGFRGAQIVQAPGWWDMLAQSSFTHCKFMDPYHKMADGYRACISAFERTTYF